MNDIYLLVIKAHNMDSLTRLINLHQKKSREQEKYTINKPQITQKVITHQNPL